MAGMLILSDKLQMELEEQTDLLYLAPINLMLCGLGLLCALACKCS